MLVLYLKTHRPLPQPPQETDFRQQPHIFQKGQIELMHTQGKVFTKTPLCSFKACSQIAHGFVATNSKFSVPE